MASFLDFFNLPSRLAALEEWRNKDEPTIGNTVERLMATMTEQTKLIDLQNSIISTLQGAQKDIEKNQLDIKSMITNLEDNINKTAKALGFSQEAIDKAKVSLDAAIKGTDFQLGLFKDSFKALGNRFTEIYNNIVLFVDALILWGNGVKTRIDEANKVSDTTEIDLSAIGLGKYQILNHPFALIWCIIKTTFFIGSIVSVIGVNSQPIGTSFQRLAVTFNDLLARIQNMQLIDPKNYTPLDILPVQPVPDFEQPQDM